MISINKDQLYLSSFLCLKNGTTFKIYKTESKKSREEHFTETKEKDFTRKMCLFLSKREDHPENVNLKIGIYPQY